ncbi:hypothetical protein D3C81_2232160 [compost metagenome]
MELLPFTLRRELAYGGFDLFQVGHRNSQISGVLAPRHATARRELAASATATVVRTSAKAR